jgi:hypothetical protein
LSQIKTFTAMIMSDLPCLDFDAFEGTSWGVYAFCNTAHTGHAILIGRWTRSG